MQNTETKVFEGFENSMIGRDLSREISGCERQELTSLFIQTFQRSQPVLEGGCGSGKWLHFLKRQGIECVGLDWSKQLQSVSQQFDASVRFDTGDLRDLPYADGTFGGVMALGSIEHVIEGPAAILKEFYRVLRQDGVGIITVPYYSPLGRVTYGIFGELLRKLKRLPWLRKLLGKPLANAGNPVTHQQLIKQRFRSDIYLETDFDGYFFEYQFTPGQLREVLGAAGFTVERIFAFAGVFGLFMRFGRVVGKYDRYSEQLQLTVLGKLLSRLVPAGVGGHMICAVVRKLPSRPDSSNKQQPK